MKLICSSFLTLEVFSLLVLNLFLFTFANGQVFEKTVKNLNPVVLFPGILGSRLEMKVDRDSECYRKTSSYVPLWINFGLLFPTSLNCFVELIKFSLNETSHVYDSNGIQVRAPDFGGTESIEHLDSIIRIGPANYMANLVGGLVNLGYKRGVSVRGAPYDFRLGLYQLGDYFKNVKKLIEETYVINEKRRVILICHSLGCLRSIHFLNTQPQSWKNKYIHEYITLSAPWGGSEESLRAILLGSNYNLPFVDNSKLLIAQRSFPSLVELLPNPKVIGKKVVLETSFRNFTQYDYKDIFALFECEECAVNLKNLQPHKIKFPNVNTTCIHGFGIRTLETMKLVWAGEEKDPYSQMKKGDGDGTVNIASLEFCKQWARHKSKYNFNYLNLPHVGHSEVIKSKSSLEKVFTYLQGEKL